MMPPAPRLALALLLTLPVAAATLPPGAASPAPSGASKLPADDNVGPLVLVDENVTQVITLLERITGRMAIRSQDVPALKINFSSSGDLKRRQAEAALESLLALNGVAVIPQGDDFLKIVPLTKGPQTEAPPLFTESIAALPDSERVVARLFTLKHAPLATVDPMVQGLVNKSRGGAVLGLPASNALLVTDSLNNLKRVEDLVGRVDRPGEVIFVPLSHTRATELVKQLKSLQASGPKTAFAGETGFDADETTNQVIAVTSPANADRVREIIAKFDRESHERIRTEVINLRHIQADRVVRIIETLTRGSAFQGGGDAAASLNKNRKAANSTMPGDRPAATPTPEASLASVSTRTGAAGNDGFSPQFTAVAEGRTNALILFGSDSDFRRVREVVAKVDVKMPQVRIEAVIVEVTLGTADASGLETLGVGYKTGAGAGATGVTAPDVKFNTNTPNNPGTNKPPLSVSGSLKDFSLDTVFNLARQDTKIKVLSSPVIVTSHNSPATIKVGQKQPIVTSSASDLQNLSTSRSTVEYKDIGLQLEVTPKIGADGVVEMDVRQTIDTIIGVTVIDKNEQPIIGSREANSYLTARSDETVVLAGLQSYRQRKTKGKVWLLGDIPWLGEWLFRPETNTEEKSELIVFLKPHVLSDSDRVPSDATPGLRPDSLTQPDATERLRRGSFGEMSKELTYFEAEERQQREKAAEKATSDTRTKPTAK